MFENSLLTVNSSGGGSIFVLCTFRVNHSRALILDRSLVAFIIEINKLHVYVCA